MNDNLDADTISVCVIAISVVVIAAVRNLPVCQCKVLHSNNLEVVFKSVLLMPNMIVTESEKTVSEFSKAE